MLNYFRRVIAFYEASKKKCHCEAIKKSHWEMMCELKSMLIDTTTPFIF